MWWYPVYTSYNLVSRNNCRSCINAVVKIEFGIHYLGTGRKIAASFDQLNLACWAVIPSWRAPLEIGATVPIASWYNLDPSKGSAARKQLCGLGNKLTQQYQSRDSRMWQNRRRSQTGTVLHKKHIIMFQKQFLIKCAPQWVWQFVQIHGKEYGRGEGGEDTTVASKNRSFVLACSGKSLSASVKEAHKFVNACSIK